MLFGDRLRKLREEKGMTQAELGELIGVSDRVLGYYESNDRFPKKPELLQKLSEIFKVSLDYLIGSDGSFMKDAESEYGYVGKKQAKEVLGDVQALFAGGELPEEDKEEFFRLVTEMYFESKKINKKYGRKRDDN